MNHIIKNIKNYFKSANKSRAVIGLSGGIDSALTLVLTTKAIGNQNVHALLLPEKGISKKQNVSDAIDLAKQLKVDYTIIPINSYIKNFPWPETDLAKINTKARIRMLMLYNYANTHNALVVGTSNKSEILLGYGTKHGDFAADIEAIGSLYKTEVYKLAKQLNLPKNIIEKAPTAELARDQTDEQELGASYEILDKILQNKLRHPKQLVKKIKQRVQANKHKTSLPKIM